MIEQDRQDDIQENTDSMEEKLEMHNCEEYLKISGIRAYEKYCSFCGECFNEKDWDSENDDEALRRYYKLI